MKFKFLPAIIFIFFYQISYSQNGIAFAITGHGKGDVNWTDIRSIDLATGNAISLLFENGKSKFSFINADSRQRVDNLTLKLPSSIYQKMNGSVSQSEISVLNPSPTILTSAAIAYDQKHGKLFFASMRTGSLIWLDMNANAGAPAFYTIDKPLVNNTDLNDEAFNITRMTIGANSNGYALTNDANHLISFTTGNKIVITDLGNIVDAESSKGISVHNRCTSWGGDMVADASGKLILFTAAHQVFEINADSRVATYKGAILNLPATFSVNGAAVDKEGNVIVSSANTVEGFYKVNMKDLSAVKLPTTGEVFNASDLASSYLLNQSNATILPQADVIGNSLITIYPNPVSDGQVKIVFDNKASGEYKIELTDIQGRRIDYKKVYIKFGGQVENFKFSSKPVKGLYFINITDVGKRSIFSDKLVIE